MTSESRGGLSEYDVVRALIGPLVDCRCDRGDCGCLRVDADTKMANLRRTIGLIDELLDDVYRVSAFHNDHRVAVKARGKVAKEWLKTLEEVM